MAELGDTVRQAGFAPIGESGYSRFFTEMMELILNFGYVFVLSRKKGGAEPGHIAPTSAGELKTHGGAYRLYSMIFPVVRAISTLDGLLPAGPYYAVTVVASKPPMA
jgi:hypothetical protein